MEIGESARAKARDFIDNEKQFQLGFLPTEQSNPITATLEEDFRRSTIAGIQCLQRGDRQMPITMRHVFAGRRFAKLVDSMVSTVTGPKGRIIFSGCGATGRLSILLESMWRDFFHRRAAELTREERALADRSASIMTGGDFALIRSVEFFEDYAEGGRRQAAALDVGAGDTFGAITEGGETSSVLGTLRYAAEHGATCFLVFNNPADILRNRLDRCREAIDNPKVTVIDLYCGSMSVAGSTRMQATSSEQLLCSCALEAALCRVLPRFATETASDYTLAFERLLSGLESDAGRRMIADEIEFEKAVYEAGGRITYLADKCMLDLFTDNTERAPTFMIPPLRSSRERDFAHGTMAEMGRIAGNWMSWVSMSNKKLIDRCIRLVSELGRVDYGTAAETVFAAQEWVESQDWSKSEEPSPVQVALKSLRER